MGKYNSLRCDKPFRHKGYGVSVQLLTTNLKARARILYPAISWDQIQHICVRCRRTIYDGINNATCLHVPAEGIATCSSTSHQNTANTPDDMDTSFENAEDVFMEQVEQPELGPSSLAIPEPSTEENVTQMEAPSSQESQLTSNSQTASTSQDSYSFTQSGMSSQSTFIDSIDMQLMEMNSILSGLGLSSLTKTDTHRIGTLKVARERAVNSMDERFKQISKGLFCPNGEDRPCGFCDQLFAELVAVYKNANSLKEKYRVLTCLPGRHSLKEVSEEFGCSTYMVRKAQEYRREFGPCHSPERRPGKAISNELKLLVQSFYLDPDNSRISPRFQDTIRVLNNEGQRVTVPKHHLLHNLKDLYALFKAKYPNPPIKIAKFAQLRPKQALFPKWNGFHTTCKCEIHENFKFMYEALFTCVNMKDFLATIMCNPVRHECAYGLCDACPKEERFEDIFAVINDLENVRYKQWIRTDGTDFSEQIVPTAEFQENFKQKFMSFMEHDFVNRNQKIFLRQIKNGLLQPGEGSITIQVDFAQNYSFIIQDSVQGYHWTNKQATLHPFAVYRNGENGNEVWKHYCVISDTMTHNADTFHVFKKKVVAMIINDLGECCPTHIYYVSDGAGGQYKNWKNFAHLMHHFDDFGITAEWHCTATGHGKGPCDGCGAVVKRFTRLKSLKGSLINSSLLMFQFCEQELKSDKLKFIHVTHEEIEASKPEFLERYKQYRPIPGTRKQHAFIPIRDGKMVLKKVSLAESYSVFNFKIPQIVTLGVEEIVIGEYYAFVEAEELQIGMLVDTHGLEAEFQCMKIRRRGFQLRWPVIPVIHCVPTSEILARVTEPRFEGNMFRLSDDEVSILRAKFRDHQSRNAA